MNDQHGKNVCYREYLHKHVAEPSDLWQMPEKCMRDVRIYQVLIRHRPPILIYDPQAVGVTIRTRLQYIANRRSDESRATESVVDVIGPASTFPRFIRRLFLKRELCYRERLSSSSSSSSFI